MGNGLSDVSYLRNKNRVDLSPVLVPSDKEIADPYPFYVHPGKFDKKVLVDVQKLVQMCLFMIFKVGWVFKKYVFRARNNFLVIFRSFFEFINSKIRSISFGVFFLRNLDSVKHFSRQLSYSALIIGAFVVENR